jgi:hypothetical protein
MGANAHDGEEENTAKVDMEGKREPRRVGPRVRVGVGEKRKDTDQERQRARVNEFFGDYSKASHEWDNFRRTQNLESLREAARILEELHGRLQKNKDYWDKLHNLPDELESEDQKAEVEEWLQDFDVFLARETHLLLQVAQLRPQEDVLRFLGEVNDAVRDRDRAFRMVHFRPDLDAIKTLRDRSKDLQEALHTVHAQISDVLDSDEPHPVEDPRRYRWVHVVRKSLLFLSGSVLAAFNMFLLDPSNPAAPSMISGCQSMLQQFPESSLERIEKEVREAGKKVIDRGKSLWKGFRSD